MEYLSVAQISSLWGMAERSVRNYCAQGRVDGAVLVGKTWKIPSNAQKPSRANSKDNVVTLFDVLRQEKDAGIKGGIYHKTQIELTYNSNHIEGSRLTHDQTRFIYETNTIGVQDNVVNVDDIIETANHFRCIDMVIDNANLPLSESFIKQLHATLKAGTQDSRKSWFAVGEYKKLPNEVGGNATVSPEDVATKLKSLISTYNSIKDKNIQDIISFHYEFESIHPFQDGNGRVGRLILFKECLKHNIVPFTIDESLKLYYYRGLKEWKNDRAYLIDTCLSAQDKFKTYLDYFRIEYDK